MLGDVLVLLVPFVQDLCLVTVVCVWDKIAFEVVIDSEALFGEA